MNRGATLVVPRFSCSQKLLIIKFMQYCCCGEAGRRLLTTRNREMDTVLMTLLNFGFHLLLHYWQED